MSPTKSASQNVVSVSVCGLVKDFSCMKQRSVILFLSGLYRIQTCVVVMRYRARALSKSKCLRVGE